MRNVCWQSAQATPSAQTWFYQQPAPSTLAACPLALSVEQEALDSHHPPPPRPSHSREGQREVEALAQASEGDEGASREAAGGHLAEGLLEVSGRAVALETADQQVDAGAPVLADTRAAAA